MKFFFRILLILFISGLIVSLHYPFVYSQIDENEAKAKWIYTLIPYISWSNKSHNNVKICTIGREPIYDYLGNIVKLQNNKDLKDLIVERKSATSSFTDCHILYIGLTEQANLESILAKIENKHILTISSIENFAERGGIIEFFIKNDGLVIRINEKPAKRERITIDSDLLGFAETIYK